MLKWGNTQFKVENGIQTNIYIYIFFDSLKFLAVDSIGCREFRNTTEREKPKKFLVDALVSMH